MFPFPDQLTELARQVENMNFFHTSSCAWSIKSILTSACGLGGSVGEI